VREDREDRDIKKPGAQRRTSGRPQREGESSGLQVRIHMNIDVDRPCDAPWAPVCSP
jgi:hypothetical protein